jgi:nucleoside-diphosphate-sugar epimerase/choline dehydrogenase-like flavoprotein
VIIDLETATHIRPRRADVCIVGAGAAGIVLAVELAKKGSHVLLLESGGLRDEPGTQDLYRGDLAGLTHTGMREGRHRIYGGSTTRWGGQILELFEDDFARRPWVKGSGWPISQQDLHPFYARAIELEGLRQATPMDDAVWREVGLETPELGPDLKPFFSRWCREANFSRLHAHALNSEPNLQVWMHANAAELLLGEDGKTIRGLRCGTLYGREAVFTADRYVLCQGGIETARFLLQPHGGQSAPWARHPLLGRHFQDHLDVYCADVTASDPKRFHDYFDHVCRRGFRYEPRFRLSQLEQEKAGTLNVGGMVFFDDPPGAARHHVWQTMKLLIKGRARQVSKPEMATLLRNLPTLLRQMYRYQVQGRSYNPASLVKFRLRAFCEQEPWGESRITLSDEKDALGQYRAKLDWRISEREIATIRRFVEVVRDSFASRRLAQVLPDHDLMHDPAAFVGRIKDSYHHMGGVRMAESPDEGVVDLDQRVHGTTNLFVCSSAVFPTCGFSNPTHTLLALSVRLADHLGREAARLPVEIVSATLAPSPVDPVESAAMTPASSMRKKVFVTGASGFIGGCLIEKLVVEYGAEVVALVRQPHKSSRLAQLAVEIVVGDVRDPAGLTRAMAGCDGVVHCAVDGSGNAAHKRLVSVDGIRNVCTAAQAAGVKRVVHLSTVSVYGPTPAGTMDESTAQTPHGDAYGESKLEAEKIALEFNRAGLPVTVLQPTVVYGPAPTYWTTSVAEQLGSGLVVLPDGGEGICNAVYVDDVAEAICCALRAEGDRPGPYLISARSPVTWADYYRAHARWIPGSQITGESLDLLQRQQRRGKLFRGVARKLVPRAILGKIKRRLLRGGGMPEGFHVSTPGWADAAPARRAINPDVARRVIPPADNVSFMALRSSVSIRKAREELGYEPRYDLDRAMEKIGPWLQSNGLAPRP